MLISPIKLCIKYSIFKNNIYKHENIVTYDITNENDKITFIYNKLKDSISDIIVYNIDDSYEIPYNNITVNDLLNRDAITDYFLSNDNFTDKQKNTIRYIVENLYHIFISVNDYITFLENDCTLISKNKYNIKVENSLFTFEINII